MADASAITTAAPAAAAPRKRKPDRRDYHVDKVKAGQWSAFGVDEGPTDRPNKRQQRPSEKITHVRALLTRLQHEIYCARPAEAMRLLSLLMRDFSNLKTPLAQAGVELVADRRSRCGE